ncbi:endonuclease/exonuclease/phosphatase family protein [Roseiconus lacunae]|uniref:endonuclease/exonuclease/phosphatase family protein n=1 Tax=Roseiconus lacunae TaxID=2605694 RepID=UPI0030894710|nr:endonuclease/exonuclease/phosphatase family protein [Stieleria sp. HD01]
MRFRDSQQHLASVHFATPEAGSTQKLRLMTYNVHSCLGMDGQLSPKRIARVIAQADIDVVALQELDVGRSRSGGIDQAHEIARRLRMDHHFHASIHIEEERYGDAILSRLPMRLIRSDELPFTKPHRERRCAIRVEVTTGQGRSIQIINTHLSLYPNERKQQALALTDQWVSAARLKGPVVLCGDFNATPRSPTHRAITQCLQDLHQNAPGPTTATWFSHRPLTRIDHVFASDEVIATRAEVIASDVAKIASDHLPLVVEIEI